MSITESPPASPSLFPLLFPLLFSPHSFSFSPLFTPEHRGVLSGVVAALSTTVAKATPLPRWAFRELFPPFSLGWCILHIHVHTYTRILIHVKWYARSLWHIITNFNATREKERNLSMCRAAIPLSRNESFNRSLAYTDMKINLTRCVSPEEVWIKISYDIFSGNDT